MIKGREEKKVEAKSDEKKDEKNEDKKKVVSSSRNLWISGLASSTRATDLKAVFSKYGKVIGAKVVTNARTPGARCYGYVTMNTSDDAGKCIQHLNRTELHGRMITVEKAKAEQGPSKPAAASQTKKEDKKTEVGKKDGEKTEAAKKVGDPEKKKSHGHEQRSHEHKSREPRREHHAARRSAGERHSASSSAVRPG